MKKVTRYKVTCTRFRRMQTNRKHAVVACGVCVTIHGDNTQLTFFSLATPFQVTHEQCEPLVLRKVCAIFVSSIQAGELGGLTIMAAALVSCYEPERGVIILEALESVRISDEAVVKPLLVHCMTENITRSFAFKPLLTFLSNLRAQEECEWVLPAEWANLVSKGLRNKSMEMAFLMKELRLGGMLSTVGTFKDKNRVSSDLDDGRMSGQIFDPSKVTDLVKKVHTEYKDGVHADNYHEMRKKMLILKRSKKRVLHVDGSVVAEVDKSTLRPPDWFKTIGEALEVAEEGDEIHVFPKADGSSYRERLVINKAVTIKGMTHTFKAETRRKKIVNDLSPRSKTRSIVDELSPRSKSRRISISKGQLNDSDSDEEGEYSTLDIVDNMVTSLKNDKLAEEAADRQKKMDVIAKTKGEKIDKKVVCIEYFDEDNQFPVIRSCAVNVRLQNITVRHSGLGDTFAAIFASFGMLRCQQVKVCSDGGDGIYVSQGGRLRCSQGCFIGPCKRNGIKAEGLCTELDVTGSEVSRNTQCGVTVIQGASVNMKKCRINSNNLYGVSIGHGSPADLMQNSFEHNAEMHLFVDASWFPTDKLMINISNSEVDDGYKVNSRLNTIKSTKTWSRGRRYSLHGTQSFMDALGETKQEDKKELDAKEEEEDEEDLTNLMANIMAEANAEEKAKIGDASDIAGGAGDTGDASDSGAVGNASDAGDASETA